MKDNIKDNKIKRTSENIKPFTVTYNNKNINFCVIPVNNINIRENLNWKEKKNFKGCIYSTPQKGLRHIKNNETVLIFEANMDENRIEGMGIIQKKEPIFCKHKIYNNNNNNRYCYKGENHFEIQEIINIDKELIEKIEKMIFTGYWHMKRINSISLITKRIIEINKTKRNNNINFDKFVLNFDKYF